MKLLINGTVIDRSEYTDGEGLTISTIIVPVTGATEKTVSQEFILSGTAYELVKAAIIDNPNGLNEFLSVKIYEDKCCENDILLFEGIIRGDDVSWCDGDCFCAVQFREHTEATRQMDCVRTTLIYDNHNTADPFTSQAHPKMVYCVEMRPEFLAHLIMIFGIILNLLLFLLIPTVAFISVIVSVIQDYIIPIVNAVISVVNFLSGGSLNPIPTNLLDTDGNDQTSTLQEYQNYIDILNQKLVGCGRKHPSPLVRSYVNNVCSKCGISFESSIFNETASDYYNTVYWNAPVNKGSLSGVSWIDGNEPILTLDLFLDQLKLVFNAEWKIINGVLIFERHDFFNTGDVWVNFESLKTANMIVDNKICYDWREEQRPAFAKFAYSQDAIDIVGNEALIFKHYKEIVEWNLPYSELQSGHIDPTFPFGAPRFRDDDIDQDVLTVYESAPFGIGDLISQTKGAMILPHGVAALPKLLIWNGEDVGNGKVENGYSTGVADVAGFLGVSNFADYNWPLMLNEFLVGANTPYVTDTPHMALYGRFWAINNPKLIIDQGKSFTFQMYYNCESLSTSLNAQYVQLPIGIGRITQMEVNLDTKTIQVSGNV
jgi:hypothetical protein